MPDAPEVWSDGSLVLDSVTGVSAAGAGLFAHQPEHCWSDRRWGHFDRIPLDRVPHSCRVLCLFLDFCRLYRGLSCGVVILALQSSDAVHVGVDNLGVVRHVGRLLDGKTASRPFELIKDGDLILLIERMLRLRGLHTVRICKVKGHGVEALVRAGSARDLDRLGNKGADEAADFGRRRVPWWIIDARRNYSGVCARWRPLVLGLHRFFMGCCQS